MEVSSQYNYITLIQPLEESVDSHKVERVALQRLSFYSNLGYVCAGFTACLWASLKLLGKEPRTSPWLPVVLITISYLGLKAMNAAEAKLKTLRADFEPIFYQQAALVEAPRDTFKLFARYGQYLNHLELTRKKFVVVGSLQDYLTEFKDDFPEMMRGDSQVVYFKRDDAEKLAEILRKSPFQKEEVHAFVEKQKANHPKDRILWDFEGLVSIFDWCPHLLSANVESDWVNAKDLNYLLTRQKPGFQLHFL